MIGERSRRKKDQADSKGEKKTSIKLILMKAHLIFQFIYKHLWSVFNFQSHNRGFSNQYLCYLHYTWKTGNTFKCWCMWKKIMLALDWVYPCKMSMLMIFYHSPWWILSRTYIFICLDFILAVKYLMIIQFGLKYKISLEVQHKCFEIQF